MLGVAFLALAALLMQAKETVRWTNAVVLHAEYRVDHSSGLSGGGGATVARGVFDFDTGATIYTAVEFVAPNMRLPLNEGDRVDIAIEKKTLILRMDGNKVRKMKLESTAQRSRE